MTATLSDKPKHDAFLSSKPWGKGSGNKSSKKELTENSQSFNGIKNFLDEVVWTLGSFLLTKPNWVMISLGVYGLSPLNTNILGKSVKPISNKLHIVPEVIIPISHSGGIALNVDWIVSFNSFNSFSVIDVSIIKKKTGYFDSFWFNLYSIVLDVCNNSIGKFSGVICWAYSLGKAFLLLQKGHIHALALKSNWNAGESTLLHCLQRTGS